MTLAWDPNPAPDIVGYRLYCGTSSRVYSQRIEVGNVSSASVSRLQAGKRYFFAATDYNRAGQESAYSNEVSFAVPAATPTPTPAPSPTPSGITSAPTIAPGSGTYHIGSLGGLNLGLNTLLPNGYIRYTIDGTTPTSTYGTLAANTDVMTLAPGAWTVKAIAYDPSGSLAPSSVGTYNFTVQANADPATTSANPVVQPPSGSYNVHKRVQNGQFWYNVCSSNPAAQFRATIDGTNPDFSTGNGVLFNGRGVGQNYLNFYFGYTQNYTLKVRAKVPGLPQSNVVTVNISLVDL